MSRPVPKPYPGIRIQNAVVGQVGFDQEAFMKLFFYKTVPAALPEFKFLVKKMGMIVIGEVEEEVEKEQTEVEYAPMNRCGVLDKPVTTTPYLLDNRKLFLQTIRTWAKPYVPRKDITCDNMQSDFELLPHQKLVSEYLKIETPYRGLLLYHGLGSGKTCSAIAIAEKLKPYKNIVVMTPKSLQMNFIQELKKCGDPLYNIHQSWEWVKPTPAQLIERCLKEPIRFKGQNGLWVHGGTDYADLSLDKQQSIQAQIDLMIRSKYTFIVYNGINRRNIHKYTRTNPFTDNTVIVDEAHNFVSRIINAIKDPDHPSCVLYRLLMEADNCKVVMLSGTPMINYPHEISVLFNMLRGYMTTWTCKSAVTVDVVKKEFPDADLVYRMSDRIHVTHSPKGFVRAKLSNPAVINTNYDTSTFEDRIQAFFKDQGTGLTKKVYTALPDNRDEFDGRFVENGALKNKTMLEGRMIGLVSYFPDLKNLMPSLKTPTRIHRVPMAPDQFGEYTNARIDEQQSERRKRKDDDDQGSSYRIQSRLLCNTTYPTKVRKFRPSTKVIEVGEEETEEIVDVKSYQTFFHAIDKSDYCENIQLYSPKYDDMVKTIREKSGLQLVYSQFLNIEGIKLFARVLNFRGFAEFDLNQTSAGWSIRMPEKPSPMYIIYGGSITAEKKEVFRNIYNQNWDAVPESIREQAKTLNIPLFMITSAGAEGISLKNVQYVHLMEPYWNPVRIDQVIGRARRICSHNSLPEKDRFVEVHLYLSVFPPGDIPEALKKDGVSTDEYLYGISQAKRSLSDEILKCIRRSSIDCSLYGEECLQLNTTDPESIAYHPNMDEDISTDKDVDLNIAPNFQGMTRDGVKVYLFTKLDQGMYPLYREKKIGTPIGYLGEDKKTLYDKDRKTKVKKLSDL